MTDIGSDYLDFDARAPVLSRAVAAPHQGNFRRVGYGCGGAASYIDYFGVDATILLSYIYRSRLYRRAYLTALRRPHELATHAAHWRLCGLPA